MELGKLGTFIQDNGGPAYDPMANPLLRHDVWGFQYGWKWPFPMNPVTFANVSAANAIAKVVSGIVVPDPQARGWNLTIPVTSVLAIELESGKIVNAGYICSVMGNDVAFRSAREKSEVICSELLQTDTFDPTLADKLYSEFSNVGLV